MLPLYCGNLVTIQIPYHDEEFFICTKEYKVSKALLCKASPVFSRMVERRWKEKRDYILTLEEIKGVVTSQSLEALLQWLYLQVFNFDPRFPGHHIGDAVELARLADKYNITSLESVTARCIKKIIIDNPAPFQESDIDKHTYWIGRQDIESASHLRPGHPVRQILAEASVAGYLRSDKHKFAEMAQNHSSFGSDLLLALRKTMKKSMRHQDCGFDDPITGEKLNIMDLTPPEDKVHMKH